MLQQNAFSMRIMQQSIQIISMLQQTAFTIGGQQSMQMTFNVTAGRYFSNRDSATINAKDFNVSAGYRFYNMDNATINTR